MKLETKTIEVPKTIIEKVKVINVQFTLDEALRIKRLMGVISRADIDNLFRDNYEPFSDKDKDILRNDIEELFTAFRSNGIGK